MFCSMPANFLSERFSGNLCLTVIYFSKAEMHNCIVMTEAGADRETVRDIAPVWTLWVLQKTTTQAICRNQRWPWKKKKKQHLR